MKIISPPKFENGFVSVQTDRAQIRIWFLGDGVVRSRTSFSGQFPEHSPILLRTAWEDGYDNLLKGERCRTEGLVPAVEETPEGYSLQCNGLVLDVNRDPYCLTFSREGAAPVFREVPGRAYLHGRRGVTHSFCLDGSGFYGFGEKTGHLEKTGQLMRFSNKDACGYDPAATDPLYKHLPFFLKLKEDGSECCGVFYHTAEECTLDMGREYNGYYPPMGQYHCCSDEVDLFLMAGPTMEDVISRFTCLTGRPALLPGYALGYLGSTMFYTELPENCDRAVLDFVAQAEQMGIPCSNFQLSSGYTTDDTGRRNVFSWNRRKFPDPAAFAAAMDAAGAPITPNIKPAMLTTNPLYAAFRDMGCFIHNPDGTPYLARFWGGTGSFVDFSNPRARGMWKEHLKNSLLEKGVYSVWNDNNEFDISDEEAICDNEGQIVPAVQLRGVLPMLMNIASKEALEEVYPNKRLYQVTRSGCAGICRYAQTWTGDNRTGWDSLRYNIATMLGSSLSGLPLTGSDIGGFAGPAPEKELFLRWIWCGVLMPRFTIHSANSDNTVTEPWMFPEQMSIIRKAFRLRSRLMPLLYSLHEYTARTGAPILRPMVYAFPRDLHSRREDVDFLLGDGMLCACVVEQGAETREVWLPEGEVFYDLFTRQRYVGGQTVVLPAPLDGTPLLQRGGSILPMQEEDGIHLWVCPERDCRFALYEDDGSSNDYRNGLFLRTEYSLFRRGDAVLFTQIREGTYNCTEPVFLHIQCTGKAPAAIYCDGAEVPQILGLSRFESADRGWRYDHSTKVCCVKWDNGRQWKQLDVHFGTFDLIRMDPE